MSDVEVRHDVFTDEEVVFAPHRRNLVTRAPGALPSVPANGCPFCKGHEAETEQTILALPSASDWHVRVVGNKYPLAPNHEVVIETPDHDGDLADYTSTHLALLLSVVRDRVRALEAVPGCKAVSVFRNRGRRAGSSQPHPHLQIAGLTLVPPEVRRRTALAEQHFALHQQTLLAYALERELAAKERLIEATSAFVAFVPYASHRPFETWIAPTHNEAFSNLSAERIDALTDLLSRTLRRLRSATENSAANILLRLMPVASLGASYAFWYFEIAPRFGAGGAGFELSTGMDVVTTTPEDAARALRAASP
ncbi:MAG: DUF4931 domain-containing protein [Sandaracinaceae bacterium]|nr:DUF4931 domain-containing protein [Sandaracinaceae bacterium]